VRYLWLALIAVSLGPIAVLGLYANPLVFLLLGPDEWRDRVSRLHPYRRWLGLALVAGAVATAVYGARYG
jgi:hypothetical protein